MGTHVFSHQITLLLGLVASLSLLYYCFDNPDRPGITSLTVFVVGISIWIFSDLLQIHTEPESFVVLGMFLRFLGIETVIIGIVLLGLEYSGRERYIRPKYLAVLAIKPFLMLGMIVSPYRSLLYETEPSAIAPWGYELVTTPLFLAHVVYSWTLVMFGLGMLVVMAFQASVGYRQQLTIIVLGITFPFILNILFNSGVVIFDLTAPGLAVSALVLTYATLRMELIETMPVARRAVLEEMDDLVLIVDADGRIIRTNEVVPEEFGEDVAGDTVQEVLGEDAPADPTAGDHTVELVTEVDGEERYFSVSKSVLRDYRDNVLGQVLVCRDTTDQVEREQELRRREEELELLKDLQSDFLEQNLRSELEDVRERAAELADGVEDDTDYQAIVQTNDRLLEWESKARTIERLIEQEEYIHFAAPEITEIVADIRKRYPDATIETDLDSVAFVTVPQIVNALENLLDNAVRYNDSPEPWVRVAVEDRDEIVLVEIEDDGPGISAHEIEAIKSQEETQLKHGSGFGLWLVYWVVNRSGGELSFETNGGTTICLTFPPATADVEHPQPDLE